ncbi:hypothetical protein BDP27DRAFT_1335550 [Rhodocollybia butyracea]|uniref:Uncharacterized protein n=1 Tax=Rhodocollybia butyracea TaxID=206335 RepID=A0A9P5PH02_9AGAR|nr:hypothetical protein BDP27DRAFT_1335550 [Rhodocollybia butyracea]
MNNFSTQRTPLPQYKVKNKNPLPKGHFSVLLRESQRFLGKSRGLNGNQNITRHQASICFKPENQYDEDERKVIGKIEYTLINRSRIYNGKDGDSINNFRQYCNGISDELGQMHATLFNEDGEPKNPALEEYIGSGSIVYLDSIELEVEWRGYGIGLLALDGLLGLLPSFKMDSVIVHPTVDSAATQAKLVAYYSLLGMDEWTPPNAEYKLLGMWTGCELPRIKQIVPHLF